MLRYGWHGMDALVAVLNESLREDQYREYTAVVLHSIGRGLFGEDYPVPEYHDLISGTIPARDDLQTGEEIIAHLIKRLGGEVKK